MGPSNLKPKIFIDFGQLSPEINEAAAENFFSGAIEEHNLPSRSVVTNPPRRMDDVFRKSWS
jgi:hypothetical protein